MSVACFGIKWKTRLLLFLIEEEKIPHPVHQWNAFTISQKLFWLPFPKEVKLLCLSTPERRALQTRGKTARPGSTACRGGAALSSPPTVRSQRLIWQESLRASF